MIDREMARRFLILSSCLVIFAACNSGSSGGGSGDDVADGDDPTTDLSDEMGADLSDGPATDAQDTPNGDGIDDPGLDGAEVADDAQTDLDEAVFDQGDLSDELATDADDLSDDQPTDTTGDGDEDGGDGGSAANIWSRGFGDNTGEDLVVDGDGNVHIAGNFGSRVSFGDIVLEAPSGTLNVDGFIASYDPTGTAQWAHRLGGAEGFDSGFGIGVDDDGNVYVAGHFVQTGNFGGADDWTSDSGFDVFIASFTSTGVHRWDFALGGGDSDSGDDTAAGLAVDSSGNTYILGSFEGGLSFDDTSFSDDGLFIASLNQGGTPRWVMRVTSDGGPTAWAIAVDEPGARVVGVGVFSSAATFFPDGVSVSPTYQDSKDAFVVSVGTASGTPDWANSYGGDGVEEVSDVAVDTSDGSIYVVGWSWSNPVITGVDPWVMSPARQDCVVASLSRTGGYNWLSNFGSATDTAMCRPQAVAVDNSGRLAVSGLLTPTATFPPLVLDADDITITADFQDGFILIADAGSPIDGLQGLLRLSGPMGFTRAHGMAFFAPHFYTLAEDVDEAISLGGFTAPPSDQLPSDFSSVMRLLAE